MGFVLTPGGVLPSEDKTRCIKEFKAPQTVKGIREFTGLCNYFRHFIPSYARVAGKLTKLLTKKGDWKGGELPREAQEAFEELKNKLCSQPILDFPRPSRQFVLTTDAATGDAENPGGLGAVLTQVDPGTGQEKVIAYASRSLKTHEKNYSAFLAELTAIVWAIDHFHWYLKGRQFILQTDHKPLEKMNSRHTKTLNMLQIRLMEYNFIIRHKAGKENAVADFLSRNAERVLAELATVGLHTEPMAKLQAQDEFGGMMIKFLRFGELPGDRNKARWIQKMAEQCKMSKGILQIMDKEVEKIVLPTVLKQEIWQAFHCSQFGGHYGYLKTLEKIRKGYWWPRMATEVKQMVDKCGTCRACKNPPGYKKGHAKFQTIEVPDVPNERVHMDLFGPLKVSSRGKKYVLVVTDAFTKYVEVVAIPDKTAEVVAEAFFERWVCRYSVPKKVVTDRGWEFCAEFSEKLYKLLDIQHARTASWHPQTNSAAESFNRTMIKYMRVMLEEKDTLDWEQYLAPLMLCYNTAVHKSTSLSPFFLTFLHEPRLPYLDLEEEKTFYTDDFATNCWMRLQTCYRTAKQTAEIANKMSIDYANRGAVDKQFEEKTKVMVQLPPKPDGNYKFKPLFKKNYEIVKKIGNYTYVVRNCKSGRRHTLHADKIIAEKHPQREPKDIENNGAPSSSRRRQISSSSSEVSNSDEEQNNQEIESNSSDLEEENFYSMEEDEDPEPNVRVTRSRGPVPEEPLVPLHAPERKVRKDKGVRRK